MTLWTTDLLDDWTLKGRKHRFFHTKKYEMVAPGVRKPVGETSIYGYTIEVIEELRKKLIEDFSKYQGSSISERTINYRFGTTNVNEILKKHK